MLAKDKAKKRSKVCDISYLENTDTGQRGHGQHGHGQHGHGQHGNGQHANSNPNCNPNPNSYHPFYKVTILCGITVFLISRIDCFFSYFLRVHIRVVRCPCFPDNLRHKHRHKHKYKTSSISYGRTEAKSKENSFCFVFVNLREKVILCHPANAYVAIEDHAAFSEVQI